MIHDLYFGNCDGHMSNILCQGIYVEEQITNYNIFSIDHGGSMSNSYKDPLFLDYTHLKQLSFTAFNDEVCKFTVDHDTETVVKILLKHGISQESVDWHNFVHTTFVNLVGNKKVDIFPGEIASILVGMREFLMRAPDKDERIKALIADVSALKRAINTLQQRSILSENKVREFMTKRQSSAASGKGKIMITILNGQTYCLKKLQSAIADM